MPREYCKKRCRATACTAFCSHLNGRVLHFKKSAQIYGILFHAHISVTTNMEIYQNGKLQGNPAATA